MCSFRILVNLIIILACLLCLCACDGKESKYGWKTKSHSKDDDLDFPLNCTPRSINDFPPDLFTTTERSHGAICIHILVSIYIFYAIMLVCDDYFIPSIQCVCDGEHENKFM